MTLKLLLTTAERKLLCESMVIPDEYLDRIRLVAAGDSGVAFAPDVFDDFLGYVAAEANHTKSRKKQKALDVICEKMQRLLQSEEGDTEPSVLDFSHLDPSPVKLEDQALAQLNAVVNQIEQMCKAGGLDFDSVLEGMKPTRIGPEEKIGVNLVPAEKGMIRGLAHLSDEIKSQIRNATPGKRKLGFTLRQINEIENAISQAMQQITDHKQRKTWERLDGKFIDVQTKYCCDDRPQNLLLRAAAGEPVSRGAAVRELLVKMLEARKGGKR